MSDTPGQTARGMARPSSAPAEVHARVRGAVLDFLEHYCERPLVDEGFLDRAAGGTGGERLASLLESTGYGGDEEGFIGELVARLEASTSDEPGRIEVGGVVLPYHLLLHVLEVLLPGTGFKAVKKVTQLERLLNIQVQPAERADLQKVLDLYPVRLSWHVIRQMRLSRHINLQYRPFTGELDAEGHVHTWVGQFHRGIIEQMYRNRLIFIMNMSCPVYCRFCFRKHKECRNQQTPTKAHVKQAVAYLRENEAVREVVLTGGDPFMNRATLQYAVQELGKVGHIQTLRLASRAVSYYPDLFLKDDALWLNYLVRTNLEMSQKGKRIELATHFIHPDEISVDALHIISHLVRNGVPVYVQTPLMNGCNETGRSMLPLFQQLRAAGAEMHYIFMPTSPIQGNAAYWTPISRGLETARWLRAHVPDRAIPHVTTATCIGKIDWNTSGWAVERKEDDPRYVWIRTPYNPEYFEPFAPFMQWTEDERPNGEGTLDAAFMVEVGDDALLAGPRALTSSAEAREYRLKRTAETVAESLESLQGRCLADQRQLDVHIGPRPAQRMVRPHRTRVELDCSARPGEVRDALDYLRQRGEITEVLLSRRDDVMSAFSRTMEVVDALQEVPHLQAIRLRSLHLVHAPERFSRAAIERLASRNRLAVTRPCRLEVEILVLHGSEIGGAHARVVRDMRRHGITVYANTPLLGWINDNEQDLLSISHGLRDAGIEFCNVYVAGLPVQDHWNRDHPIELNNIIDIASHVRLNGSGREVPRYLVRTLLGEVDFSIVPRIFERDGSDGLRVRLLPHDLDYFREIDPGFAWPDWTETDTDGHPLVPVIGLDAESQDFFFGPDGKG